MQKQNTIYRIFSRLNGLLFNPEKEWKAILQESPDQKHVFLHYIIFPDILFSLFVVLLRWAFSSNIWLSLVYGAINFIACFAGALITWKVSQTYLENRTPRYREYAFRIAIYCSFVFLIFRSISYGFAGKFMSDLVAVLSLFTLYTLYIGIQALLDLNSNLRKNALIIIGLLIIVVPLIITKLLDILLGLPAINV